VRRLPERGGKPPESREKLGNREEMPGLGREQGKRFFKNELWAHRTAHSSCPVNHQTAHRRMSSCARGRCTGQCTVQCPVHTGLSGDPRQRKILKFLNFSI
jgi:hypothetical protein